MTERGISSVTLAQLLGVSKATISNLINNKTMPSIDTLEKLAEVLDIQFVELFAPSEAKDKPHGVVCPHCGKFVPLETKVASSPEPTPESKEENEQL